MRCTGDSNFCSLPAIIIDIDPNQREEIYDQTDLKGRLVYPFFLDIPLNDVADHRM